MPPSTKRTAPPIADHELLRCIGRGSYGEVWLARGVTGAWRAVKVVYREDFEDDHSFEREFQGILAYEPLSRRHQGLVEILHVGRNERLGFYFYVMELGDDQQNKQDIEPVDYEPRTLRGDVLGQGSYELSQVREIALQLAEAIAFLHEHDLVHRDIKPANIIFVEGKAKLADIGLVAAHGQLTYVGTEGFSPPEGPGSAQGDVYALGKVIYELASGRDRMEFPAPPAEFENETQRQEYLALDRIVCRAAEPRQNRRYRDGEALADDLRLLQDSQGLRLPRKLPRTAIASVAGLLFIVALSLIFLRPNGEEGTQAPNIASPTPIAQPNSEGSGGMGTETPIRGQIRIISWPTEARVLVNGIELAEKTNTTLIAEDQEKHPQLDPIQAGDLLEITLLKEGYRQFSQELTMPEASTVSVVGRLENWRPPQEGETWVNHLGMEFSPQTQGHRLITPLLLKDWLSWTETEPKDFPPRVLKRAEQITLSNYEGQRFEIAALPEKLVQGFANWLAEEDRRSGFLSQGHYYEFTPLRAEQLAELGFVPPPANSKQLPLWQLRVLEHQGEIRITSDPQEVNVFLDESFIGTIRSDSLLIGPLEPGTYQVRIEKPGYQDRVREVVIEANSETIELNEILIRNDSVVFNQNQDWRNSVGMRFTPFSKSIMVSIFETTRNEYQLYLNDINENEGAQAIERGQHPIADITREEAESYARWLTQRERVLGLIDEGYQYRLPTDEEWSRFAKLEEPEGTPLDLSEQLETVAWNLNLWPPPEDAANYGISDRDGYPQSAPVGQFNILLSNLEDLCGNVGEWVSTPYDPSDPDSLGVVRGGSFLSERPNEVWLSSRYPVPPDASDIDIGFRLVLERLDGQENEDSSEASVGVDEDGRLTPAPEIPDE